MEKKVSTGVPGDSEVRKAFEFLTKFAKTGKRK